MGIASGRAKPGARSQAAGGGGGGAETGCAVAQAVSGGRGIRTSAADQEGGQSSVTILRGVRKPPSPGDCVLCLEASQFVAEMAAPHSNGTHWAPDAVSPECGWKREREADTRKGKNLS